MLKTFVFLAALASASAAHAAVDLKTTISVSPSTQQVYASARYTVTVQNIGNQNASNCTVQIQLPRTNTSPQVYVMGIVGAKSASCTQSGTNLNCTLGTINRNNSKSVFVDLSLPVSAAAITTVAVAATTSNEPLNLRANNTASHSASQTYFATTIATTPTTPEQMRHRHCTGTGLVAWWECTFFPSSITFFDADYHDDGSITIAGQPSYSGTWTLTPTAGGNFLEVEFSETGVGVVATFEGWGADGACFEGLTTFPGGGAYVSPYEICPL